MFGISIVYLIGAIILILFNKIEFDYTNFFNTDGLALLGCIFALGELIFSKRNWVSTKINERFIEKKYVNYRIDICSTSISNAINIEQIANILEDTLQKNLEIGELGRKAKNKLNELIWALEYENVGITIEYIKQNKQFFIVLKGKTQFGKIGNKDRDILYLSLLIKLLASEFMQEIYIKKTIHVNKIDIIINREGSQLKLNNIFNENLMDVEEYNFKITKDLVAKGEVIIDKNQIKLTVLNETSLLEGFMEFINIICKIN